MNRDVYLSKQHETTSSEEANHRERGQNKNGVEIGVRQITGYDDIY